MGKPGNPYGNGKHGYFNKGPKRIQYASSDERDDAIEAAEDLKDTQIQKSQEEQDRLNKEEKIRDIDKRINQLENEIRYHEEKSASAYSSDDRKAEQNQIRLCKSAIKKLKSQKD